MIDLAQHLIDGLSVGSTYALLALGLTLVFSVMNLINFAYGILLVASGYVMHVLGDAGVPFSLTVFGCLLVATALSVAMGQFAFKPFIGAPPTTLLITSFGVLLVLQYVAILLFTEQPRGIQVPEALTSVITFGSLRVPLLQVVTIACGALVVGAFYALLERTSFGAQLRASAELPDVARLMGVRPDRLLMWVFVISGVIAGLVGMLWFAKLGVVSPRADLEPTLKAFIAIVLGGLGSVRGAVIGGLALGFIEVMMAATLPAGALAYAQGIVFVVVIGLLLLRPDGLTGRSVEVA